MKTDQLLSLLAADAQPVAPRAAMRRLGLALVAGVPLSIGLMVWDYGVRRDLAQAMALPMFWVKLLLPLAIAAAAFAAAQRLGRPGMQAGPAARAGLVLPVVLIWGLAAVAWLSAAPGDRPALLWGSTWRTCAFSIGFIALPVFVATLAAMKSLAPTRPALAGGAAGLLAGALGAAVYALHCPELTAPFIAVWYGIGIVLPALAGAAIGWRWLRW